MSTISYRFLITGGAGFIGSAVIRHLIHHTAHSVINVDKLTYCGNLSSLAEVATNERYHFIQEDICDARAMQTLFIEHQPDIVMHLAAETHVDRSIANADAFIRTNIMGTYHLLEQTRGYWSDLVGQKKHQFRFHHISTDEVFGDLSPDSTDLFTEETAYRPSSPYSASKASADHLVSAWHRTYGLPTIISNTTNNYGPYQYPEKLIPHTICNAIKGQPLPLYGDGQQSRDWIYVEDHAEALVLVALNGRIGETYNISSHQEVKNIDVVHAVCRLLDELAPIKIPSVKQYADLITPVKDRPGHDKRYAVNADKIRRTLQWTPRETFESGLRKTVLWYLNHPQWQKGI